MSPLVRLEPRVDPLELRRDAVEPLEQRVELRSGTSTRSMPRFYVPARASRRARPPASQEDADERPERVDPHVERRADLPLDERLADLVADGVEHRERDREPGLRTARQRSAPRIAYSATCASFRRIVSHVPSSVERLGTDEKAKITPAQRRTGAQEPSREPRVVTAGRVDTGGMVGSPTQTERGEGTRCESGTVPPL
jgi:hypothetical protein